jgi:hypothetical protein
VGGSNPPPPNPPVASPLTSILSALCSAYHALAIDGPDFKLCKKLVFTPQGGIHEFQVILKMRDRMQGMVILAEQRAFSIIHIVESALLLQVSAGCWGTKTSLYLKGSALCPLSRK